MDKLSKVFGNERTNHSFEQLPLHLIPVGNHLLKAHPFQLDKSPQSAEEMGTNGIRISDHKPLQPTDLLGCSMIAFNAKREFDGCAQTAIGLPALGETGRAGKGHRISRPGFQRLSETL